jgi:hypothetical protein
MTSRNLNFLEPFGPLQASNWTALPLPFIYKLMINKKIVFPVHTIKAYTGQQRYRSYLTTALDGSGFLHTRAPLSMGENPGTH